MLNYILVSLILKESKKLTQLKFVWLKHIIVIHDKLKLQLIQLKIREITMIKWII